MAHEIRDLTRFEHFLEVQSLHQRIFNLPPGGGIYPALLNTIAHNGGTVLGAFDRERLIGFIFGVLGRHQDGSLKLCSQTMGILPEYRGQSLGIALKWTQRTRALAQNIRLITWTFDPLVSRNAYLNLHKLGAVCRTYYVDLYKNYFGQILPSDRLLVEWNLTAPGVEERAAGRMPERQHPAAPTINAAQTDLLPATPNLLLTEPALHLQIPANIQQLKQTHPDIAKDWRLKTRAAFQTYFGKGYCATDLVRTAQNQTKYLLRRTA